jgi:cell division protein FtsB
MSARATATSPAEARGKKQTKGVRLTPRAAVLLVSILIVAMFSIAPMRAYLVQRSQLHELEHKAADLEAKNADLERHVQQLNDPATLQLLARECLGMVDPGEIAFVVIPKGRAPTPPDCS